MTARRKNKIPFREKLGYGVGALSYGIPFQMLSGFFLFYANSVLGLSGTITGLIFFLSIVWDALTDPIMGYISDKTNQNIFLGRRLFYVFIGAIGIAVFNLLIWNISPEFSNAAKAFLVAVLLILVKTFSTIFTTPYLALGAELSSDYNERTSVQSFRTAFFFLGFLFPTVIGMGIFFRPTPEYAKGQLNPAAYSSLGITSSIIVLICAVICIILTYQKSEYPGIVKTKKSTFKGMMRETLEALNNTDFRNISICLLFVNMAMGIVGAVGMNIFTFTFDFNNVQIAIVFGFLFLMTLLAQPFWLFIATKYEKKFALKVCLIINIAVSVVFIAYTLGSEWVASHYLTIVPLAMLMGLSLGGSIALPYSMISDTIDEDAYYTGLRKEGVFYGCATFMYKLSQSAAVMFVGVLLDVIKFNAESEQPRAVYLKLGLILPVGFLICFILALIFTQRYTLDREKVARFQQKLP